MSGFPAGRIAGIPIAIHWSALAVAGLFSWVLATGLLPEVAPGGDALSYWYVALGATVLFGLSLLAHEVGHAVAARRHGVGTDGITLWGLGGVARLDREAPTPRAEVVIAGAGPAASAGLAVAFLGGAGLVSMLGAGDLPVAVLAWLGLANAVLAVFNLLPGAPLDGGRIVRGVLWWRTGDRERATIGAARAGQVLGGILVLAGITGLLGGLLTVVVGVFVFLQARAEARAAEASRGLRDVRVGDVVGADAASVPAWWSVRRFVEEGGLVRDAVLVHDDGGRPSGIVTGADLARLPAATWDTTVLGGVAVPVAVLERVEASESVAAVLGRWDGRPLAVVRDGSIVGVLSAAHLLRVAAWGRLAGRTGTRVG